MNARRHASDVTFYNFEARREFQVWGSFPASQR